MKFITFQPKCVADILSSVGVYNAPKNEILMSKIFCLKVDSDTMERLFMCAPSMPQIAIIFETEEYAELDSVTWVNKLSLGLDLKLNTKYKEYLVDRIYNSSVIEVIDISNSDDPIEVQNDFMNTHFKELEQLSGHRWHRLCDREDLFGTAKAEWLLHYVSLCMMPYREVTEKDFDRFAEIIREEFCCSAKQSK